MTREEYKAKYDKLEYPKTRMLYEHITGKIFCIWGVCADFKLEASPMVLMADVNNGDPVFFPLDKFWDKHPDTGIPRFQLVTSK